MRHELAFGVLAVVAAVGLASAGGLAGSQADAVGESNDTELAPGLTADGVTDPLALARAHDRALRNASYTLTSSVTHRYRNGTLRGTSATVTSVAADGETFARVNHGRFRNGSGPFAVTTYERRLWSNGSQTLVAQQFGGDEVEYERREGTAARQQHPETGWETVYAVLAAVNTTVVGEVEQGNATLYRVVATGVPQGSVYDDARPFTMTALVDARGVVRSLSVSHPSRYEDQPAFVTQTLRVTNVGNTTVERPAWAETAIENATSDAAT